MELERKHIDEQHQCLVAYLGQNYHYCYLKSMHYINEQKEINTIITGSSYGLEPTEMDKAINLCMHSQDLYYDYLHVKRAVQNGKGKIKKCFITLGYYSLFYDQSLTVNKYLCYRIYEPLFDDLHHAEIIPRPPRIQENPLCEKLASDLFLQHPSYYKMITRERLCQLYSIYPNGWQQMTEQQRDSVAREAVAKHHKFGKYHKTFEENKNILKEYVRFLSENDIVPIVIHMPFAEEYLKYIMGQYKEITLKILDEIPYQIEYMDLNDTGIFEVEDFLDAAHLNQKGALKATHLVNEVFGSL